MPATSNTVKKSASAESTASKTSEVKMATPAKKSETTETTETGSAEDTKEPATEEEKPASSCAVEDKSNENCDKNGQEKSTEDNAYQASKPDLEIEEDVSRPIDKNDVD